MRGNNPGNHDRGKDRYGGGDPTFWAVFNEHTNPLPEDYEQPRRSRHSVYFLHCPLLGRVKIGTTNNVKRRRREHEDRLGSTPTVLLGCAEIGRASCRERV